MLSSQTGHACDAGRLCFGGLAGWDGDDLDAALAAFRRNPAQAEGDGRRFFEMNFRPGPAIDGQFTGYFEPEIEARLTRSADFPVPIHAFPAGCLSVCRSEIGPQLEGHEIAWVRDAVDRFFLQVQGSGRLLLPGGARLRIGYAGTNGHPYRSIGRLLVERGIFGPDITADLLRAWLRQDTGRGLALMDENPSYVMFRTLDLPDESGPPGTLCPVTAGRSLAVDPAHLPLGTPVWIEVDGLARLCIAQDTGSAIKGPGRADLFFGTGSAAGTEAGRLNHPGRFIPLVPR